MKMEIFSINQSDFKGKPKTPVPQAVLKENYGMQGDAHAGKGICQISMLSLESMEKNNHILEKKNAGFLLKPGDFAENITTKGIDLSTLIIGDVLQIGETVLLEISQKGKICHGKCSVFYRTGDCIMPRECVFAIVKKGGIISQGNAIALIKDSEKNESLYINRQ